MCEWAGVLGVPRVRPSMPLDRSRYVISTMLSDLCTTQGHRGPLVEFEFNCLDQNDQSDKSKSKAAVKLKQRQRQAAAEQRVLCSWRASAIRRRELEDQLDAKVNSRSRRHAALLNG